MPHFLLGLQRLAYVLLLCNIQTFFQLLDDRVDVAALLLVKRPDVKLDCPLVRELHGLLDRVWTAARIVLVGLWMH